MGAAIEADVVAGLYVDYHVPAHGHSPPLPAGIHHMPGSASYYLFWQALCLRQRPSHSRACAMVATCLDRRCALLPQLRAAELKFAPGANPLQFTYIDENSLKTEQCRLERVEGSEISHTWYVVPDRPAAERYR